MNNNISMKVALGLTTMLMTSISLADVKPGLPKAMSCLVGAVRATVGAQKPEDSLQLTFNVPSVGQTTTVIQDFAPYSLSLKVTNKGDHLEVAQSFVDPSDKMAAAPVQMQFLIFPQVLHNNPMSPDAVTGTTYNTGHMGDLGSGNQFIVDNQEGLFTRKAYAALVQSEAELKASGKQNYPISAAYYFDVSSGYTDGLNQAINVDKSLAADEIIALGTYMDCGEAK